MQYKFSHTFLYKKPMTKEDSNEDFKKRSVTKIKDGVVSNFL